MARMPQRLSNEPEIVTEDEEGAFDEALETEDDDLEMGDMVENEDGSVTILDPERGDGEGAEFDENLANVLDESRLREISATLQEYIEDDERAREERQKRYAEGLKRTGMAEDAPGGADFEGASKATHPALTESCIDFAATAIKELLPPEGPVKMKAGMHRDKETWEKADRKKRHMNWQLTEQCPEFPVELEQMLTQLPMGGSQYIKVLWERGRPRFEFIPIDDLLLPYMATSFLTSPRFTHRQRPSEFEYRSRISSGLYRDIEKVRPTAQDRKETAPGEANDKIEGREDQHGEGDEAYILDEVHVYLDLEGDDPLVPAGEMAPYIITLDNQSGDVLGFYRNWDEGDQYRERLEWIVDYTFVPWRGAYGVGFPHLIGGLNVAATGALRALLDSAHVNNAPSLVRLKGSRVSGQSQSISATQVNEIEGPAGIDDVRKVAMALPFNPPSPTLFQLLGFIDTKMKGVVTTAEEKLEQVNANTPVGTAQMQLESGAKIYAAIHSRLHRSQKRLLRIVHRLNRDYMEEEQQVDEFGEVLAQASDYDGPVDVVPVSDPNIYSDAQRYAQVQGALQLASTAPQRYDEYQLHRRALEQLKIPNIDEILPPPEEPEPQNPVAENVAMLQGQPAIAFPDQDHLAHIQVHLDFMRTMMQMFPTFTVQAVEPMLEHLKQHVGFFYVRNMMDIVTDAAGQPIEDLMDSDMETQNELAQTLAAASQISQRDFAAAMQGIPAVIRQAMELIDSFRPKPQPDPSVLIAAETERQKDETRRMEIQQRGQQAEREHERSMLEMAQEAEEAAKKLEQEERESSRSAEVDLRTNRADNRVRLMIEDMKRKQAERQARTAQRQTGGQGEGE